MEKDMTNVANYLVREAELSKIAKQPNGLNVIANLMMKPLVRDLLHESRVRQVYATYQLGLGEEALLDADVSVKAYQIAMNGLPEAVHINSDRVRINTTPISILTKTRWNESNYRKYDILTRAQERAKSAVMSEEDLKGFSLLKVAATDPAAFYNDPAKYPNLKTVNGGLGIDMVAAGITYMLEARINPNKMIINPRAQKDLLMLHTDQNASQPLFMPEQSNENMKKGIMGKVWNLTILNVPNGESFAYRNEEGKEVIEDIQIISPNDAFIVTDPEKVGVMAIRTDLTVETQKMIGSMTDDFLIWEDLGFIIRYTKGIMHLDLEK
jgi:hypothetical protein